MSRRSQENAGDRVEIAFLMDQNLLPLEATSVDTLAMSYRRYRSH